jgi:hypothetical protein
MDNESKGYHVVRVNKKSTSKLNSYHTFYEDRPVGSGTGVFITTSIEARALPNNDGLMFFQSNTHAILYNLKPFQV